MRTPAIISLYLAGLVTILIMVWQMQETMLGELTMSQHREAHLRRTIQGHFALLDNPDSVCVTHPAPGPGPWRCFWSYKSDSLDMARWQANPAVNVAAKELP